MGYSQDFVSAHIHFGTYLINNGLMDTTVRIKLAEKSVPVRLFGICGGQSGTGTGFPSRTSITPCQYHSINAPYSIIHQTSTLYNLAN
jgi:hypothetical protein